ncbi:MAG: transcription antitermination factor NusB [Erysipelotrichaceae bacterium]|nr:transcription antitermination factor NusB [Erysipelotrichaceae bacterium]
MNQRSISLNIIYKTISDESYSNLLMRKELNVLPVEKRSFCTNLVNGVLRNYEFLQYQFVDYIDNNTSLKNKLILTMATYEKFYLNKQDYVINNEYVELGDNKFDKAFINAVLHKIHDLKQPNEEHIIHCLPSWIYNLLKSQYTNEELNKILNIYRKVPKVYYRINKSKVDIKQIKANIIDDEFFTSDYNLINTDDFKNGYFYIQDYNSGQLYKHLNLNKDNSLLDVCCAPGGKLFNCLDVLDAHNCYANDIYENRINLIKKAASRLGFEGINYLNYDGRDISKNVNVKFDRILLDAPCSGLGVIGRKPDLKFHIQPSSLDELQVLQYELLDSVKNLLADDGILLYSTCTLNKKENRKQIDKFINNNPDFMIISDETIINDMGDCFYYCILSKV